MRYAARIDQNQPEIVTALRKIGAQVACTSTVGQGFPDLVIAFRGRNILMELKDPKQPLNKRKLTPAQVIFHSEWTGELYVVETIEQAIEILMRGHHGQAVD